MLRCACRGWLGCPSLALAQEALAGRQWAVSAKAKQYCGEYAYHLFCIPCPHSILGHILPPVPSFTLSWPRTFLQPTTCSSHCHVLTPYVAACYYPVSSLSFLNPILCHILTLSSSLLSTSLYSSSSWPLMSGTLILFVSNLKRSILAPLIPH